VDHAAVRIGMANHSGFKCEEPAYSQRDQALPCSSCFFLARAAEEQDLGCVETSLVFNVFNDLR
jgi:hypothetical protein